MNALSPELIADSFVTVAAVMGLVLFRHVLRSERTREGTTPRFIFAINVIIVMLVARLLQWFSGWDGFGVLTYIAACFVPLAVLLVTESVLRRHMPKVLKIVTLGGAVLLSLSTILNFASDVYLYALAIFQFVIFAWLAVLVARRDRLALSAAENVVVDRLAMSFLLLLPFAITDFRTELIDMPVRMSGIAILMFCWLAIGMRVRNTSQSEVMVALVVTLGALFFSAITIANIADLTARASVQMCAVLICASLLARIIVNVRDIRSTQASDGLLAYVATASLADHASFISGLQTSALTSGALVLSEDSLTDFDDRFRARFQTNPILRQKEAADEGNAELSEQLDWFFRKYDATHAMLVARAPFQVMALNIPVLSQSDEVEHALSVAQRMAVLLAETRAGDG